MMIMIFEANIKQMFRSLKNPNVAINPDFVRIKNSMWRNISNIIGTKSQNVNDFLAVIFTQSIGASC